LCNQDHYCASRASLRSPGLHDAELDARVDALAMRHQACRRIAITPIDRLPVLSVRRGRPCSGLLITGSRSRASCIIDQLHIVKTTRNSAVPLYRSCSASSPLCNLARLNSPAGSLGRGCGGVVDCLSACRASWPAIVQRNAEFGCTRGRPDDELPIAFKPCKMKITSSMVVIADRYRKD